MALPPPTGSYVRQDIDQLISIGAWDPYSLGYARAVGAMQELSEDDPRDPRGWTFQAYMHGFPPGVADPDPLWGACQHGSWYSLPWHRMLVYMFERIVRAFVIATGGPLDWALPFWNWTANPSLPLAFRQETLPDGADNPLYVGDHRNPNPFPGMNGGAALPPDVIETDYAMSFQCFGGGSEFGGFEDLQHDHVHDLVGGPSSVDDCGQGWMSDPSCAALDPIFWLHHSNIDRLWVAWMTQGGQNPTDLAWTAQEFSFYDSGGQRYSGACGDVVSTLPLGYTYSYPSIAAQPPEVLGLAPPVRPRRRAAAPEPAAVGHSSNAELGASREPVALGARPAWIDLPLGEEAALAVGTLGEPRGSRRSLYLTLEHVELDAHPGVVYAVYLNKPLDLRDAEARTYRAGMLSLFGLMHSHGTGHEGHRAPTSAYDVTSVVAFLRSRGDWDPTRVRVTFEPLGLEPEDGGSAYDAVTDYLPDEPKVRVGRVCLRAR